MNSDKSNEEDGAISSPILNYCRRFSQNKDLSKYFRGTSLSYMPQIVPNSDEQVPEPQIHVTQPPNEEMEKGPSPTSSVTSNRKLEWDNGADIGYDNLEKHSLLQKSHSLPILPPKISEKSPKSIKSIERITISSSSPSNSNDLIEAIIQSSSDSFPVKNPVPSSSSSSSMYKPEVSFSDSSKKVSSLSYLKDRIGSPEAESTPKFPTKTDFYPQTPFVKQPEKPPRKIVANTKLDLTAEKKIVNLSMTKPISIECLTDRKVGNNKKVQTNNVEKLTKSIQTDQDFNGMPLEMNGNDNQSIIIIDCIESETEKTTQTDSDMKGSKCNSFEYVHGDVLQSSNPPSSETIDTKTTNSPVEEEISQKQSSNLINDIDKTINLLQKLLKSKKYNSTTKRHYVKKLVRKILDSNYIDDSTTSSELFRPKKPEPTQLSTSSSNDRNVQPKLQDNIPWYPAPRTTTKNLTIKTFNDEILPQPLNDRLKRNCFTLTNNEFQIRTPSTSTSLEKNRSSTKSSDYQSWKLDKTKSEYLLEEKKLNCFSKGDHLVEFAQKERRNQIEWIKDEISHLSKLRLLLERNPKQHLPCKTPITTTTVYMLQNSSSSSLNSARNYVIQTEIDSNSSVDQFDFKLNDQDKRYIIKENNGKYNTKRCGRLIGDIEVVSDDKTTNIKVKAACVKSNDLKKYETYPKGNIETRNKCFTTHCKCRNCKRYEPEQVTKQVNECPYVFCYKNKNMDIERQLNLKYQTNIEKKHNFARSKQIENYDKKVDAVQRKCCICTNKDEKIRTKVKNCNCNRKSPQSYNPDEASYDFNPFDLINDEPGTSFRKITSSSDEIEINSEERKEEFASRPEGEIKRLHFKDDGQMFQTIPSDRFNNGKGKEVRKPDDEQKSSDESKRSLNYEDEDGRYQVSSYAREVRKPNDGRMFPSLNEQRSSYVIKRFTNYEDDDGRYQTSSDDRLNDKYDQRFGKADTKQKSSDETKPHRNYKDEDDHGGKGRKNKQSNDDRVIPIWPFQRDDRKNQRIGKAETKQKSVGETKSSPEYKKDDDKSQTSSDYCLNDEKAKNLRQPKDDQLFSILSFRKDSNFSDVSEQIIGKPEIEQKSSDEKKCPPNYKDEDEMVQALFYDHHFNSGKDARPRKAEEVIDVPPQSSRNRNRHCSFADDGNRTETVDRQNDDQQLPTTSYVPTEDGQIDILYAKSSDVKRPSYEENPLSQTLSFERNIIYINYGANKLSRTKDSVYGFSSPTSRKHTIGNRRDVGIETDSDSSGVVRQEAQAQTEPLQKSAETQSQFPTYTKRSIMTDTRNDIRSDYVQTVFKSRDEGEQTNVIQVADETQTVDQPANVYKHVIYTDGEMKVCKCKDENVQTCNCFCSNIEKEYSTGYIRKHEIIQTSTSKEGTEQNIEIETSSTFTSTIESERFCSCCKRSSTTFSILKNKLNNEIYQLCRSCYQQYGKLPINYNSPNHVCNCYTVVQTQTLYQIKQTINELNNIDKKHCTCRHRKSTYCQYCNCKLRKSSKNKNGLAYVLTFEPEPIEEKKKKKQQHLEEIRIQIPVPQKKRHKERYNKKRKDDSESIEANPYTLQDYLVVNRPLFVENAEERRKYVQGSRDEREKNRELNRLCFLRNHKSEKTKRLFSSKEMKDINRRNYKKLPEVQRKLIDNREKQVRQANRLIANTFNRKLRENVLKGKRDLPIDVKVVNL